MLNICSSLPIFKNRNITLQMRMCEKTPKHPREKGSRRILGKVEAVCHPVPSYVQYTALRTIHRQSTPSPTTHCLPVRHEKAAENPVGKFLHVQKFFRLCFLKVGGSEEGILAAAALQNRRKRTLNSTQPSPRALPSRQLWGSRWKGRGKEKRIDYDGMFHTHFAKKS